MLAFSNGKKGQKKMYFLHQGEMRKLQNKIRNQRNESDLYFDTDTAPYK